MMNIIKFSVALSVIGWAVTAWALPPVVGMLPESIQNSMLAGVVLGALLLAAHIYLLTRVLGMHV